MTDPHDDPPSPAPAPGTAPIPWRGLAALFAALAPAAAAIWTHPGFVTQDGPAHLYNAHILAQSFRAASPFREAFAVRWEPLPNWAGHLATMGLAATLPPRAADRAMTTATLAAFAAALVWLRWKVAGERDLAATAVLAVVLALNMTWLFGFTSFLLGAALFPVTLGVWWSGRFEGFSWRRAGVLAGLATLGYFCHLVSLGLTAAGLVVLEAFTPGGRGRRRGRAAATIVGVAPMVPLGLVYLRLSRRGGGKMAPEWGHLADVFSPRAWFTQLTWADPISLARKDLVPLSDGFRAPWGAVCAPVIWLAAGLAIAGVAGWRVGAERDERRGWWVLAGLLLAAGAAGPDTLGASHGHYLSQRVVLLGLAALAPVVRPGRLASAPLIVALGLQSAVVWDYARTSERTAGRIIRAGQAVGVRQRVAALWVGIRTPFRANPILHADCALGVGTGNVIWGDYETRFYYFPVRFRPGLDRPDSADLELIARHEPPASAATRARRWESLLRRHHDAIDVVVVWDPTHDPALDAINARWYVPTWDDGPVRVLHRRPNAATPGRRP